MDKKNKFMKKKISLFIAALFSASHLVAAEIDEVDISFTGSATELKNSWQINAIKAPYLWNLSVSGINVKIAEIDTGIYQHKELTGRVLAGWNFVTNKAIAAGASSDDNGHGTHVAGIIAANANNAAGIYDVVGVAPQASLIPIKVLDRNGSGSIVNVANGINYSIGAGANIVSMSLGWGGTVGDTNVANALKAGVTAGELFVIAAGNSGLANPGWPARYAKETFANGQIIAVGAVDNKNVIASWSNRAGDTANWFLVAPGVNILSTYNASSSSYAYMSGTSMATPVVSGAAALLKQGWNLSAQRIAQILFTTATDLGAKGIDPIYGRGLINLEAALSPIGNPTFPTLTRAGVASVPISTVIVAANATPAAYKVALANAQLNVAGLDDFGRDYAFNLSSLYASNQTKDYSLSQMMNAMGIAMQTKEMRLNDGKITLTELEKNNANNYSDMSMPNQTKIMSSFSFSKQLSSQESIAFGMNTNTNHFFGFSNTPFEFNGFMGKKTFDNPYLSYDGFQNFIGHSVKLVDDWSLSTALVSNFNPITPQANDLNYAQSQLSATSFKQNIHTSFVEIAKQNESHKLAVAFGSSVEKSSLLGGAKDSLFGITDQSSTLFLSLKDTLKISKDTWAAASFNQGMTLKNGAQDSLVTSTSNILSQSWSVGLLSSNVIKDNDRLGFAMSQPLRVNAGTLNLNMPVGLDYESGVMQYRNRGISLAPKDAEYDFEASYFMPTSKNASLSILGLYRMNPDNNQNNADSKTLIMRWQSYF